MRSPSRPDVDPDESNGACPPTYRCEPLIAVQARQEDQHELLHEVRGDVKEILGRIPSIKPPSAAELLPIVREARKLDAGERLLRARSAIVGLMLTVAGGLLGAVAHHLLSR